MTTGKGKGKQRVNNDDGNPQLAAKLKSMHPLDVLFFCENVLRSSHHNA